MSSSSIDFNTQRGIANILFRVRSSDLSDEEKNELRDQIFTYVRSGGDHELRDGLLARIQGLPDVSPEQKVTTPQPSERKTAAPGATPEEAAAPVNQDELVASAPSSEPVAPVSPSVRAVPNTIGRARTAPKFAVTSQKFETSAQAPVSFVPKNLPVGAPPQVKVLRDEVVTPPQPIEPQVAPAPLESAAPTTPPTQQPVVAQAAAAEEVVLQPEPVPRPPEIPREPIAAPAPVEPAAVSEDSPTKEVAAPAQSDPLERIRQIKAEINSVVGNPVHLMANNNPVGREYMTTLLEAIKTVNAGTAEEINVVMAKLEVQRERVLEVAKTEQADSAAPSSSGFTASVKNAAPAVATPLLTPEPPVRAAAPAPAQATVVPPVASPSPAPAARPAVPNANQLRSIADQAALAAPTVPEKPLPAAAPTLQPEKVTVTHTNLKSQLYETPQKPEPVTVEKLSTQPAAVPNVPSAPAAPASTDPLHEQVITSGLDQLLSEWDLFKSSGIFGTGPSGREHPLYQKLAKLPMAAIVSGRFEGVTNEIRQSITDYMNGWRYEQGLVHDTDETFEHYLRRVIAHIINKQKRGTV